MLYHDGKRDYRLHDHTNIIPDKDVHHPTLLDQDDNRYENTSFSGLVCRQEKRESESLLAQMAVCGFRSPSSSALWAFIVSRMRPDGV